MSANASRQMTPTLNLGHQPPNTIRPSSSPNRHASLGSVALRRRSANSKNCSCFFVCASILSSISSTSIRFALSRRVFAVDRTRAAIVAGKLTLWRMVLLAVLMAPLCKRMLASQGDSKGQVADLGRCGRAISFVFGVGRTADAAEKAL